MRASATTTRAVVDDAGNAIPRQGTAVARVNGVLTWFRDGQPMTPEQSAAYQQRVDRANPGYTEGSYVDSQGIPQYRDLVEDHRQAVRDSMIGNAQQTHADLSRIGDEADLQTERYESLLDDVDADIDQTLAEGNQNLDEAQQRVDRLPEDVRAANQQYIDQFADQSAADLDRIEAIGREAVAATQQGRYAAMEAAVQAQQGELQRMIADINANPDIPPSMKQSMISRVRLQGSMSIASTVGTTVAQFNEAQTSALNNMASNLTQLMSVQETSRAGLFGTAMQTESGARVAAAQLGTQITEMRNNLRQWTNNARTQTTQARFQAQTWRNQFQAALVPLQTEARSLVTQAHLTDLSLTMTGLQMQFESGLRVYSLEMMRAMSEAGNNNMLVQNLLQGLQWGPLGLAIGGGAALLQGSNPVEMPAPNFS